MPHDGCEKLSKTKLLISLLTGATVIWNLNADMEYAVNGQALTDNVKRDLMESG